MHNIVKPVSNNFDMFQPDDEPESSSNKKQKKKNAPLKMDSQLSSLNDMVELQEMLNRMDDEDEDLLIEDESIYSLSTGQLDVGELIAQNFWLGLDPYPKKPGTEPLQLEITG